MTHPLERPGTYESSGERPEDRNAYLATLLARQAAASSFQGRVSLNSIEPGDGEIFFRRPNPTLDAQRPETD